MKFSDTIIPSPNTQNGDFNKAEELLRNSNLTTFQIHKKTGVSEPRIDKLRMKIRLN